ncbi:H+ Antiporter protein [Streptococcus pseudopneumoniae]|nr:H+ Antiporter protein [Streptococcus pseudopneumoniae]
MSILLIGVASYSAIVSTKLFLIIYLLSFFVGIFVQLFLISWENKVLKEIPEKYLTMVSSFNWIVLSSLNPIALTIVGNFSEIYGTRITVTFSMVFVSILIMMTLIINFINQNNN